MLIYRIEHSGLLRDDYPAGPYGMCSLSLAMNELTGECHYAGECLDGDWSDFTKKSAVEGCPACTSEYLSDAADCYGRHPLPEGDGIGYMSHYEACGFPTFEQLKDWFSGYLRLLNASGFVVGVYEVDDARHGDRQSVFNKETAVRLYDFSTLARGPK